MFPNRYVQGKVWIDGSTSAWGYTDPNDSGFFDIFLNQDFVWLPGDRAAYSDLAFILLGYALENATRETYPDIIKNTITTPLGLKNTGFDVPSAANSIIPQGTPWFGFDLGNFKQYVLRL